MKKDGNSPARQGINSVYDLNDLLNELWHVVSSGKERKALLKVERVLHDRICNGDNPDCWKCQCRYWLELQVTCGESVESESQEESEQQAPSFNMVRWLNESINAHLRARRTGQSPTQPPELLANIHAEIARKGSHALNCMFCVAQGVSGCLDGLTAEQHRDFCDRGFNEMLDLSSGKLNSD